MLLIKVLLFFCYCFSCKSVLLCLATLSLKQRIQINFKNKRKQPDFANGGKESEEAGNPKRRKKNPKKYKCDVCNKWFITSTHCKRHQRIHTGDRPFECEFCQRRFAQSGNLMVHKRSFNGGPHFACDVCTKMFPTTAGLMLHKKIHNVDPFGQCSVCKKQFATTAGLVLHERVHTGEKPYTCDVCQRAFSQSWNMQTHKLLHDKEEFYQCEFCPKTFVYETSCKKHQLLHDKEESYKCEFCPKTFVYEMGLKKHKQRHSDYRSYPCDGCEKRFEYSVFLKWHKEKHVKQGEFFTKGSLLYLYKRTDVQKKERVFSCANEGCGKSFCTQLELFFHNVTIHIKKETTIEDLQIEFDMFFEALREGRLSFINEASFTLFFEDHNKRIKKLFERQSEENENDESSKCLETKEEVKDWEFLLLGDILSLLLDVRWSSRNEIEKESSGVEKIFPENSFLLINDKNFLEDMKNKKLKDSEFALFLTILLDVFDVKPVTKKLKNILNKHMSNKSA